MWKKLWCAKGARTLVLGAVISLGGVATSEAACVPNPTNVLSTMLVNVCWSCFFPISLASISANPAVEDYTSPAVGPGLLFPDPNPYPPPVLCSCECLLPGLCLPGLPLGYWEPTNLLEVVHEPFCSPSLGVPLGEPVSLVGGGASANDSGEPQLQTAFWHVHYVAFPVFYLAGVLVDLLCLNPGGVIDDLDILYFSELDPLWDNDALTAIFFPESTILNTPVVQLACLADAAAATAGFPLDALFWCAGGWGSLYPPTGTVSGSNDDITTKALTWARLLHRLARVPLTGPPEFYTAGNGPLLCWDFPTGGIVKSQYKMQVLWPIPNVPPLCCSPIGRITPSWGLFKTIPGVGENHVFLLWKLKRCCLL